MALFSFLLQEPPSLDLEGGVFRAWWFEPFLSTGTWESRHADRRTPLFRFVGTRHLHPPNCLVHAVCFGIFINLYWYHERIRGQSSSKTFGETVEFHADASHDAPLFYSALAYWVGIYLWKLVVPPAAATIPDGIPYNLTQVLYLSAELISGVVLYDAIFFVVHWTMHAIPWLRQWHGRHHQPKARLEARDTLRHGILDGSLQVLVNIAVQRHTPWGTVKTRVARALHNVVVIWMLTESHAAAPVPNVWRRWCVGVREHYLHHEHHHPAGDAYGPHHRYQQFFGYLDDLRVAIGTWQVRWGKLQEANELEKTQ